MSEGSLKSLQNGSDVRGTALENNVGEAVNLTARAATRIAAAFAVWLKQKTGQSELRVSLGRDCRLSSPALLAAAAEGLSQQGVKTADFGLCTTPAMFMSTVTEGYLFDGAVMITASHLPFQRNGMKFFTREGGLEKADITAVLQIADSSTAAVAGAGKPEQIDFLSVYAAHLREVIKKGVNAPDYEHPLTGMKVAVDAGNGDGGFFAGQVLTPLGADTAGSCYLEPDGSFPNHIPNPENETAMQSICGAVLRSGADLGVIFDTDVDRAAAVDRFGHEINRNRIVALASAVVLEEHPGTVVVTDSVTSDELAAFLSGPLGGRHHRFKRGYKNVIDEAIRLNAAGTESWLAIETSGHAALRENYFLDDGAYLIAKILIKAARLRKEGKTIDTLLSALKEPAEAKEFRFSIKEKEFYAYGEELLQKLAEYAEGQKDYKIAPDNHEGIRVSFGPQDGSGWFLLRLSLHDPVMPLNIESSKQGGVKIIAQKLMKFLKDFDGIDTSSLSRYAEE